MGVPALFRWLSKKYPRIINPVEEDDEIKVPDETGNEVVVPVNMSQPNPNGTEFDNLYLDMNGIVHPCTHPEGRPAPETEEEMMIEIFRYTERVVNMVRPRKLLFMAIDGVAPRAKMNQQRSRRFRSSREAEEKEEARLEAEAIWKSMGKTLSDDDPDAPKASKKAWDSNAITPGTPFMDLLSASLRYWVAQKMNQDAGWQDIQVIISDSSVPGEGEHKIMDYIRRQRTNDGHDPNTQHVIYGLDADLIMLALATHEPYFKVLREDVFNDATKNACRTCGQPGHYSAECTAAKAEVKAAAAEKKPFVFLDVATLREYLEVELDVSQAAFPFNFEQAIDDWVLLIFFVGNDFLPHLPSLEIREGAIDTLLKIWKLELPRMGGYLTNHGHLELDRAQIILEGLAKREDDIFRRRREAEERQDSNAKRRKLENDRAQGGRSSFTAGPSESLGLTVANRGPPGDNPAHPSLPKKPNYDFAAKADSIGLGAAATAESQANAPAAALALAGSNRDVVANRRAIRMANMSAAEMLKAELSGAVPVKPVASVPAPPVVEATQLDVNMESQPAVHASQSTDAALPSSSEMEETPSVPDAHMIEATSDTPTVGSKRAFDEGPGEDLVQPMDAEDEAPPSVEETATNLKVNPDGTVEQQDTVMLWEPGYRERYYRQKFGFEYHDKEAVKAIVKSYIEGMVWVLQYYYQGAPSWQWFYPYHFAPFACDFEDIASMDLTFTLGQPFKPFEQLMAVFPAASRSHIPDVFHPLMTEEDSPIIDFYPLKFEIDMNGKKMAWQGVALLPFIDESRLLAAMSLHYDKLNEEEKRRNKWGNDVIFAADGHPIYPFYEQQYGKRKSQEPVPIDPILSKGISGSVLPNPDCLPGSTFYSPLSTVGLPDIKNDRSLSVLYMFPKMLSPHRSVLLPGLRKPPRVLNREDLETARNGGRGRGRGRASWDRDGGGRGRGNSRNDPFHSQGNNNSYGNGGGGGGGGGGYGGRGGQRQQPPSSYNRPPPNNYQQAPQTYQGDRGGYGGYGYNQPARPPPQAAYGYDQGGGGGYGRGGYGRPPPPPAPGYGTGSGYGGGYQDRGGYQGQGGRGGPPPPGNGAPNYQYRGRGRSW